MLCLSVCSYQIVHCLLNLTLQIKLNTDSYCLRALYIYGANLSNNATHPLITMNVTEYTTDVTQVVKTASICFVGTFMLFVSLFIFFSDKFTYKTHYCLKCYLFLIWTRFFRNFESFFGQCCCHCWNGWCILVCCYRSYSGVFCYTVCLKHL